MDAPDRDHRDRARFRLDANVVVEAGAGTGKTTLLTDRILFLVLGWDAPEPVRVERVVALTFTDKAAGEIKLRLSDRLAELAARLAGAPLPDGAAVRAERTLMELRAQFGKGDDDVLGRARAALEDLDKAPIGTIHSFCAQLLRLHPVEAGVDPAFRVDADEEAFDELFASEWAAWLDVELGERPPRRAAWLELLAAADLGELEALARELCSEKFGLAGLDGPDRAAAAALRELARQTALVPAGKPKPRGKILEALGEISARLTAAAEAAESAQPPLDVPDLPEPRAAKWPAAWEEYPEDAELYERASDAASAATARGEAAVRRAARLLLPFAERFRREYARRGWVSFDGLLRRARDLVRDRPGVREEAKRRFSALLIDEFQDTDPLQGELLMFLAEKPGGGAKTWREVVPAPGRIFVVGDPKQSIYRFRGADIAAYEGFTAHLREAGALVCDLTANFRSVPGVVRPVNEAFRAAMKARAGVQPAYKEITPARPEGPPEPAVRVVALTGEADAAELQRSEAAWIAGWIADHARMPGAPPEGRRPLKDVAVLLRTSVVLPALLDAFKRAGIPYAVDIERDFYEVPEVSDFLNLLRALDDEDDRIALAGLLRSPLAALTDGGLAALSGAGALDDRRDPRAGLLSEDERRRAAALFETLRGLRARAGRAPLGDLVGEALARTRLVELASRAYHGQQTASNLLKLKRLAVEASDGRGATLKEFAARVSEAARESRREGESPLADENLEAVRVMTMHKSKGLEFPVVFAPNLSGRPGGGNAKPVSRLDPGTGRAALRLGGSASAAMALADARERELERHESVRLLYVAMTRARETLILVGRRKTAAGALSAHLHAAGSWPGEEAEGRLPVTFVEAGKVPEPPPAASAASGASAEDARAAVAAWESRAALRRAADAPRSRAATAYLKELPKRPGDVEEGGGSPAGAEVGQICHRVLQEWDFKKGGDVPSAARLARELLERRAPGPRWEQAEGEAREVLESFVKSQAAKALAKADILGRETPFAYAEGETVVRGAADLIYREGKTLVVADFKSERVTEKSAAAVRERYAEQGRAYVSAVERAWGVKPEFRVLFLRRPDL
ncbi:MAG TPA: UvrD-helicase domain-containing protein [Elusimicrobiota bacterium]|nr:UvrD-helicase domain-containing protein [Elusimicrobiota bacterium]